MGIRKNAKFLTASEREDFVKACVLMKADIVNPGAAAADRYSKWDELVAVHRMIQNANSPTTSNVNFGHGGAGAFSFLSWHRFFLHVVETLLQSHVPGVMIPYWDWSDPAPFMTDTFMGPDGAPATNVVGSGYFAASAPGTAGNPTPAPPWWPAGLAGWQLPAAFGPSLEGPLRRNLDPVADLPSIPDLRATLARTTYAGFQATLEGGQGLASGHQMHNDLHGWVSGHMGSLTGSPFDPLFYLHHCNIDRLWAMWQVDGHASDYPTSGGKPEHHRNDLMFPFTGGASGYSSNLAFGSIVMPDFSALGPQRNVDTLDHRGVFGYTYDTLAVIGIGLDRTGSMGALTPDPMTVAAPDVTKWEAAKRGVSAFLQDCETVYQSAATYVVAGVKTFQSTGAGNQFDAVFAGTPFGLVKNGSGYSRAAFDAAAGAMSPAGGTPLADALRDVEETLVEPPFGWIPADEQRYLAMLTDGLLTTGSPMTSIADGEFAGTAIFAMGFGTGADVDYGTLLELVGKGRVLGSPQVFHGENAGTIDKFYSNALAQAIGFTTVFDPVLELFAGEHVHLDLDVTSAEDAVFVTAQGMDFVDENWTFHLIGPDGVVAYADGGMAHAHAGGGGHGGPRPDVTVQRATGRLSLMMQRDSADASAWVGRWRLMAAYRAKEMDAMVMPDLGELIWPVSAGPVRGARFARLLQSPRARVAARSVREKPRHRLDVRPGGTNRDGNDACSLVVNVYARTRLRIELTPREGSRDAGSELALDVRQDVLAGRADATRSFARLVAPMHDVRDLTRGIRKADIPAEHVLKGSKALRFDPARMLGALERKTKSLARVRDEELHVVKHEEGPMHVHIKETEVGGVYHVGMYVEGVYAPEAAPLSSAHDHDHGHGAGDEHGGGGEPITGRVERFTRLLSAAVAMAPKGKR